MEKSLTIGELNEIYKKYGDLSFKVSTPYGFKDIEWCGITEENADVYRCELEDGKYVEGADYHKLKKEDGEFVVLKEIEVDTPIQTIDGIKKVKSIKLMDFKDTLYDIQVAEVHQYYTNGIVSHNTTFSVDALKFLFFGETTKTEKNEDIFNSFRESNIVRVKGLIEIDGDDFMIERVINRKPKKAGGWSVSSSVEYKKILPDGTEEDLKGEQTQDTTKKIAEAIGSESDFMATIIATGDNLTDLIDSKPTERGKTLTKFIGLEVLDDKEEIAKKMTSEFKKTMKSNIYNIETLKNEIINNGLTIENLGVSNYDTNKSLEESIKTIEELNYERDGLLSKKVQIDPEILKLNPETLKTDIGLLTKNGVNKKAELDTIIKELETLGKSTYDEDGHKKTKDSRNEVELSRRGNISEINKLSSHIKALKEGEFCPTCKRSLEDVDHSKEISDSENKSIELTKINEGLVIELGELDLLISRYDVQKSESDSIDRKSLMKDKIEVDLERMRVTLKEKNNQLKEYERNTEFIDSNQKLESQLTGVNSRIRMVDIDKNNFMKLIEKNNNDKIICAPNKWADNLK